jgi:excisionase family DNA binding protein
MKTYDINEAAEFLKVDRSTALDLAGRGELPGAKVGRSWVFLESDLEEYLRDQVRRQTSQRRGESELRERRANSPTPVGDGIYPIRRRRREPPKLPELAGEVAPAQVGVTAKHAKLLVPRDA